MRGEIHFPAHEEIDRLFGIQSNKPRFNINKELKEVIADSITEYMAKIRTQQKKLNKPAKNLNQSSRDRIEDEVRSIAARLPIPVYTHEDEDVASNFRKRGKIQNGESGQG